MCIYRESIIDLVGITAVAIGLSLLPSEQMLDLDLAWEASELTDVAIIAGMEVCLSSNCRCCFIGHNLPRQSQNEAAGLVCVCVCV